MKKFFLIGIISLWFLPLIAQPVTSDWRFSIEPYFGVTMGHLGEYLYKTQADGDYRKISYLEWEEFPLWVYGIAVEAGYKRMGMQATVQSAVLGDAGFLYDSDWKSDADPLLQTTFSVHDMTTDENYQMSAAFSFDFYPRSNITLAPVFSVAYANQSFKAKNGRAWHGEEKYSTTGTDVAWNSSAAKYFKQGKVADIEYFRESTYVFVGVQCAIALTDKLTFRGMLSVSPYTYAYAQDIHYAWDERTQVKSEYRVYEQHSAWDRLRGQCALYYAFTPRIEGSVSFSGISGYMVKGDWFYASAKGKQSKRNDSKSGFSIFEATIQISAKVHIF